MGLSKQARQVHLVTDSFPYPPGEQFLWDEISFWAQVDVELRVLPCKIGREPARLPSNIKLEADLAGVSRIKIASMALLLPFCRIFYRELWNAARSGACTYEVFRGIVISCSRTLLYKHRLQRYIARQGPINLLYCYWNDVHAYAACLLKRKGLIGRVITRAHGGDIYRERWPAGYVPLKWQFVHDFDQVYVLSDLARHYLVETYRIGPEIIKASPLGVMVGSGRSPRSRVGSLHVVSVAFCLEVKRIDRVIEAIAVLAQSHLDVQVIWTHIGDGPLQSILMRAAESILGEVGNVVYRFAGRMSSPDIRQYMLDEPCDVFVNSSDSEGMPVSIMEAMSVGIPAVAPDIGGISDLVRNDCGRLLSKSPGPREIAASVWELYAAADTESIREAARSRILEKFNAEVNYPAFITNIIQSDQYG